MKRGDAGRELSYDVFLSHGSKDKPFVRAIAEWLRRNEVRFFLDEDDLLPGDRLTERLGAAMEASRSAIICIGPQGEGPWQSEEIDSLLNKAIKLAREKDEFRIIPVLLPDADTSNLRWFLKTRLWIDLSEGVTDNEAELFRLRQAILGKAEASPVSGEPKFNPYQGLRAFGAEDAPFFFGRAKESRELATMLREWRIACIVGPSGNGKSSLARAGLASDAARDACPEIGSWVPVCAMPGGDLLRAILVQLFAALPDSERASAVDAAFRRVTPEPGKSTAESWAGGLDDELKTRFPDAGQKVLILIDQFEEVFTHRGLGISSEDERQERIRMILDGMALIVKQGDKRWHFIFTLRSDFYQRCRVSESFWEMISADRHRLLLDELDEKGWREAVKGPAARAGAYLEAGLVETILKDVYRQRGSMPLLQLALHQLWRLRQGACLTHSAYTTIGGVENALQKRAESAFEHLKREKTEYLEIARNLFLRLTSLGEGVSDTRRRLDRSELDWENTDPKSIDYVQAELSGPDNRLIVSDQDALEVTHEVLIRECATIRGWIENARKDVSILRRLTHAARRWVENERDAIFLNAADPPRETKQWMERTTLRLTRREREYVQAVATAANVRKWLKSAIIAMIAVGFVVVVGFYRQAEEARSIAELQKKSAQEALTQSFFRTIGLSTVYTPTADEQKALWELSQLELANTDVRRMILHEWTRTDESLLRAFNHNARGAHAAVGLTLHLSRDLAESAAEIADRLSTALENPHEKDVDRLASLAHAFELLPAWMNGSEAARIADRLAKVLANPNESDMVRLPSLVKALGALTAHMSDSQATPVCDILVKALESPEENDGSRIPSLVQALEALATRLNGAKAAPIVDLLVKVLENPQERDSNRLYGVAQLVQVLAMRMNGEEVAPIAERLVVALENPQELKLRRGGNSDLPRFRALARSLAALTTRMSGDKANSIAERGTVVVAEGLYKSLHQSDYSELINTFRAFASRISAEAAVPIAFRFAQVLENPQTGFLIQHGMVEGLKILTTRMSGRECVSAAQCLLTALKNPNENEGSRIANLAEALAALIARMSTEQAASFAESETFIHTEVLAGGRAKIRYAPSILLPSFRSMALHLNGRVAVLRAQRLVDALKDPITMDSYLLSDLVEALGVVAMRIDGDDAALIAESLARALEKPEEKDINRLRRIAEALSHFASRTNGKDNPPFAVRGVTVLSSILDTPASNSAFLSDLESGLRALAARLDARSAVLIAEKVAEAMMNPKETNIYRIPVLAAGLEKSAASMNASQAAQVAECLEKGLENIQERNSYNLVSVANLIEALAARMDDRRGSRIATSGALVLAKALESLQEQDIHTTHNLAKSINALASCMNGNEAVPVAEYIANRLEMPPKGYSVVLWSLAEALDALTACMDHDDGAPRAARGAAALVSCMENLPEKDTDFLSGAEALGSLISRMNADEAIPIAVRGAAIFARKLKKNPVEITQNNVSDFSDALATIAQRIPSAKQTRLFAINSSFLYEVPGPPNSGEVENRRRKILRKTCESLSIEDLTDVLKWPFCVGEAQRLVLSVIEERIKAQTGKSFGGDLWSFVEMAPSLGIENLDRPPKRPRLEDALKELEALSMPVSTVN